jgi:hypothetical protein
MAPFLLLPFSPGGQHCLAAIVGQKQGTAISGLEIAGAELTAIESESANRSANTGRSSSIRSSAKLGREAASLRPGRAPTPSAALMGQNRIDEGKWRVDRIERWTVRAAANADIRAGGANQMIEDGELILRCFACRAAQRFDAFVQMRAAG